MSAVKSESAYYLILVVWILFDLMLFFKSFYVAHNRLSLLHGIAQVVEITDTRKVGAITAQVKTADNKIVRVKESFWANFRWWLKKKPIPESPIFVYTKNLPMSVIDNQTVEGFGFSNNGNYSRYRLTIDYYGRQQHFWSIFVYPTLFLLLIALRQFFGISGASLNSSYNFLVFYGCVRTLIIFLFL